NTVMGWGLTAEDRALLDAPLFHAGGMSVFTAPLVYVGGRALVCKTFSADRALELVTSKRISVMFGVPTMFLAIMNDPKFAAADFSGLKLMITGGAPCP